MEASENKLASILHDSWRAEKIKIGWHTPEDCSTPEDGCSDCHPCVGTWELLTDKQKELALMNSKLAHEYFGGEWISKSDVIEIGNKCWWESKEYWQKNPEGNATAKPIVDIIDEHLM